MEKETSNRMNRIEEKVIELEEVKNEQNEQMRTMKSMFVELLSQCENFAFTLPILELKLSDATKEIRDINIKLEELIRGNNEILRRSDSNEVKAGSSLEQLSHCSYSETNTRGQSPIMQPIAPSTQTETSGQDEEIDIKLEEQIRENNVQCTDNNGVKTESSLEQLSHCSYTETNTRGQSPNLQPTVPSTQTETSGQSLIVETSVTSEHTTCEHTSTSSSKVDTIGPSLQSREHSPQNKRKRKQKKKKKKQRKGNDDNKIDDDDALHNVDPPSLDKISKKEEEVLEGDPPVYMDKNTKISILPMLQKSNSKSNVSRIHLPNVENIYVGTTESLSDARGNKIVGLFDEYLVNKSFTDRQCSIIFSLKNKTLRGIKNNYKDEYYEDLLCPVCGIFSDTQEHVLECPVIVSSVPQKANILYDHLNGDVKQQLPFVIQYEKCLEERDELLRQSQPNLQSLPGLKTGPLLPQHNKGPLPPQTKTVKISARKSDGKLKKSSPPGLHIMQDLTSSPSLPKPGLALSDQQGFLV